MPARLTAMFTRADVLAASRVMKWAQAHGFIFHHTEPSGFRVQHLELGWIYMWEFQPSEHGASNFNTFREAAIAAVRSWNKLQKSRHIEVINRLAEEREGL